MIAMTMCSACGQEIPHTRLGVRLSPLKVRIFDIIRRAGIDGIAADDLVGLAYDGRDKPSRNGLKSHIWQINDVISDTGFRIAGHGTYRLVKAGVR